MLEELIISKREIKDYFNDHGKYFVFKNGIKYEVQDQTQWYCKIVPVLNEIIKIRLQKFYTLPIVRLDNSMIELENHNFIIVHADKEFVYIQGV